MTLVQPARGHGGRSNSGAHEKLGGCMDIVDGRDEGHRDGTFSNVVFTIIAAAWLRREKPGLAPVETTR